MPVDKEMLGELDVHETVTGPEAGVNRSLFISEFNCASRGHFMRHKLQLLLVSVENDAGNESLCARRAESCFSVIKLSI